MDMKRVEEIEQKLETILNFDTGSSTKLSQSSMTHEEHHSLLLELLEEDVLSLTQTIKQQQEKIERYEGIALDHHYKLIIDEMEESE